MQRLKVCIKLNTQFVFNTYFLKKKKKIKLSTIKVEAQAQK